jgi:hypothetical protein
VPVTHLSESELVNIARERIARGRLPRTLPERVWGCHKGTWEICDLCDRAIAPDQTMLEIDDQSPALQFHVTCHAIWERECRARQPQGSDGQTERPSAEPSGPRIPATRSRAVCPSFRAHHIRREFRECPSRTPGAIAGGR